MQWFNESYMKLNNDKCHLLISSPDDITVTIGYKELRNENQVNLLGVTIDDALNFNDHVYKLCNKASTKLHALARVSKYISTNKLRIIMKAFMKAVWVLSINLDVP